MEKKQKRFLTVERQLINAEREMELENHHSAVITRIINSGKKHQWILKSNGRNWEEKQILLSKYLPRKINH